MSADRLNNARLRAEQKAAKRHEPELVRAYEIAIARTGRQTARAFSRLATPVSTMVPVLAGGYVEAEHPRDPGGEGGGRWVEKGSVETAVTAQDPTEIQRLLDEIQAWPVLKQDQIEAGGASPRQYAQVELEWLRELHTSNPREATRWEVIEARRDGRLVGVGTFQDNASGQGPRGADFATFMSGGIFAANGGAGIPLFRGFLDVAADRGVGVEWTAGNERAARLYDIFGVPKDEHGVYRLTKDEVLRLRDEPYALARAEAASAADEWNGDLVSGTLVARGSELPPKPRRWVPPPGPALYSAVARAGPVKTVRQEQEKIMATVLAALQVGIAFDVVTAPRQSLLDGLGARAEKAIGEALRQPVADAIAKSYQEGDTIVEAARAIRAKVGEVKAWQAVMLARTDLIGIANGAALMQARALNGSSVAPLVTTKQWVATNDNRTRETHAQAHGQQVPIDGDFSIGGSALDYPGDPDGPDGEVINCRCTVLFLERPTIARVASGYVETEHPRDPGGQDGGRWIPKGTSAPGKGEWIGPDLEPDTDLVDEVMEGWEGSERWATVDGEDVRVADPIPQAGKNLMTNEEYQAAVTAAAKEWLDKSVLTTRVPATLLDEIIADGRLKSQFETNASRGTLDNDNRRYSEQRMFGYDWDLPSEQRPIYGYLRNPDRPDHWTNSYGEVALELKPGVRSRSTWTDGDSFAQTMVPSPINAPSHLSTDITIGSDPLKDGIGNGYYVEAQMHGGITLDDIESVHVPHDWLETESGITGWYEPDKAATVKASLAKLEALGIPVLYDREQTS